MQLQNINKQKWQHQPINHIKKKLKSSDDNSPPQILRNYISSQDRTNFEILDEIERIKQLINLIKKKTLQLCIEALCKLDTL